MKKSLIALAIASAVSAPAFAATSNVDVYGKLHASVNFFNDQCDSLAQCTGDDTLSTTTGGISNVGFSSNASRIGFKGSEDLGGGLKAIWQIESGVALDEGSGSWADRNSFVGLGGGFGTVLIGNHDTPLKLVGRAVDLFGDTMADSRNVLGYGSDTRAKNTLAYISPNMSGFSVAAAYTTDLAASGAMASSYLGTTSGLPTSLKVSDANDSDAWNVNATYANGPLYLGVGYGDGDAHQNLGWGAHWRVAGGYTFGNFKLVGQYDSLEDDNATSGGLLPGQEGDYDAWMVGGAYTMGAMVFKANYMAGEVDGVDGYDVEQWTIGMDYNLSKRTSVYGLYADGQNVILGAGAGASDMAYGNLLSAGDVDVSVISLGVVHSF